MISGWKCRQIVYEQHSLQTRHMFGIHYEKACVLKEKKKKKGNKSRMKENERKEAEKNVSARYISTKCRP